MRYNRNGECMIEHHICYREIEGWDETVWITAKEHQLLHNRLRREGLCGISPQRMAKISNAAIQRTEKSIEYRKNYYKEKYSENRDEILERNREFKRKNPKWEKEYYIENKEEILDKREIYYKENREKILKQKKEYGRAKEEEIKEYQKNYRKENRDRLLKQKKEYYQRKKKESEEKEGRR